LWDMVYSEDETFARIRKTCCYLQIVVIACPTKILSLISSATILCTSGNGLAARSLQKKTQMVKRNIRLGYKAYHSSGPLLVYH